MSAGYREYSDDYYAPAGNIVEAFYRDVGNIGHGATPTLS